MPTKRILTALVASLPLLPFLLVDPAYVAAVDNSYVTDSIGFVLAPIGIELGCFTLLLCATTLMGPKLTKRGLFNLSIATTVLYIACSALALSVALPRDAISQNTKITVVIVLIYTLVNLIITLRRIIQDPASIAYYYFLRYFLPLSLTMAVGAIDLKLLSGAAFVVNPIMVYLITRNFTPVRTVSTQPV